MSKDTHSLGDCLGSCPPIQVGLADYMSRTNTPAEIEKKHMAILQEETQRPSPSNTQVGGNHYKNFVIQPYKFCYENKLNNLQSEIVSYVVRYPYKWANNKPKQIEDLKKAQHTIALLIEQLENE